MSTPESEPGRKSSLPRPEGADEDGGRVPVFGSWKAIHLAVIACALAVMALVALFSRWPF